MVNRAALALMLCVFAGFAPVPADSKIMFSGDARVPRPVRELAWRVIETRCNYQRYELDRRSFWAYDTHATTVDGAVAYSIKILSEIPWKKTEPPAFIEMTIVTDPGARLAALRSSFVQCAAVPVPVS
jgi:hypothetical protein